jgi:phosphonate degradation associated HDIG domain protein
MTRQDFLNKLVDIYTTRGDALYGGEAVTQLEHGLQAAWLAEQRGHSSALIVASLLHDVGHLLHGYGDDCAKQGIDDHHEDLGVRYLAKWFPTDVTEPIRLHVQAKRYLCFAESNYHESLSTPSQLSLKLQGGPMTAAEADEFRQHPQFDDAIALRHFDDEAKVAGLATPSFAEFLPHLEKSLAVAN